jgi:hypothetical protein
MWTVLRARQEAEPILELCCPTVNLARMLSVLCVGTADCRLSPRGGRAREGKSDFSMRPSLAAKGDST